MNILVNGITLENANLTPLLINCKVWQSKGANITFIGNQTLKHKIIKINLIKNFHFLKLNHTKKITTKTQLITEGLKRNIQAINIIPKIKGKFNIIHSRSSVLDLVIFPFILKIIDNKIKWTTVFDNTVPSGPFLPYLLFQLSLRLLKKADIIFTISPDLKKYLIKKNFNGKKIVITGNAVETDLIKSSKIFIFPSYNESFGIALLEAVSCGLPSFAYNLKAYKQIYKNNEVLTFPIGDFKKMALSIIKTLSNKDFKNPKGQLLLNNYSWPKIAQIEYHSLLKLV